MGRHPKVHYLASRMTQDHKHVEDLKAKGRNSEEVHRPGDLQVAKFGTYQFLPFA